MPSTAKSPPTTSPTNTARGDDQRPSAAPDEPAPAASEDTPVAPVGDAGVFDVDPDQTDVSQDSELAITGDLDSFPLDVEP